MTRREHYFWARANYPDRNAIACWELSLQLLEWERNCPDGAFDEARARQLVAVQAAANGLTKAAIEAISAVASRFAHAVGEAMRSFQEIGSRLSELTHENSKYHPITDRVH